MSDQYIGEIRMFSGNFAPAGWAFCDGSRISIADNQLLFALIGTTYGGDGQTYYNLPDLRGRLPIHRATNYPLGQMGGVEQVTLVESQLPMHTHPVYANNSSAATTSSSPAGQTWGYSGGITNYQTSNPDVTMSPNSLTSVGGNQPHNNMMPSLAVSYIIALQGIFPSQS